MDYKNLLKYAIQTGEIMLKSGAETSRVEDTINRILATSEFETVESFVTPTGIFATLDDPSIEIISIIKRVHKREAHLHKIAQANDLSRRFCEGRIKLENALEELERIKEQKPYSNTVMVFAKGIGGGAFTMLLGGSLTDSTVTLLIGLAFALVQVFFDRFETSKFFEDILCGAIIGSLALFFYHFLKIGTNFDYIVIGSIMPLVPGVAITNAIRDIIEGDFVSGISRGADAFIVAASVAIGVGSILKIFYYFIGGIQI